MQVTLKYYENIIYRNALLLFYLKLVKKYYVDICVQIFFIEQFIF